MLCNMEKQPESWRDLPELALKSMNVLKKFQIQTPQQPKDGAFVGYLGINFRYNVLILRTLHTN